MFAEIARRLFEIVGKQCTARGVFTGEQLPDAIEKLRRSVVAEKTGAREARDREEGEDDPKAADVGLAQRAYPIIGLLERTRDAGGFVMWQAEKDF